MGVISYCDSCPGVLCNDEVEDAQGSLAWFCYGSQAHSHLFPVYSKEPWSQGGKCQNNKAVVWWNWSSLW